MANSVIGALRVNLGLDSAQFTKGLKQSQSSMQKFGKRIALAGAGISAVGAGIVLAMRSQLNAADDMGKLAQKIGIPVDELSRLKHAADMSGVSMGSVQTTVSRLSRVMASTPDKFKKIGVSVRNANGEMRPTSEVMADVAQVLSEMPDGAEKTALAMEYLGRSGADLIPMLNGGRDALKGMFDEADDLGIVITPEMAKNAEVFNDNLSRLQKQLGGIVTMVAANLAPAMARLSGFLVDVAARFRNMSPALQTVISGLAAAAMVLGPVLSGLGLMIMTAAPFVGAMGKVALAIKGVSMALLANPIGIAVAAIAGAAYLIYQEWDALSPWFARMWDSVRAIFGGFKDFVTGVFTGDLGGAVDGLKAVWDGLKSYYQGIWDGIKAIFRYAWENGIKPVTDLLGATAAIENGWRRLQSAFDAIMGAIGGAFRTAMALIEPVITGLKWVQNNARTAIDALPSQPADGNNRAGNGPISFAPTGGDIASGLGRGSSAIEDQGARDAEGYQSRFRQSFGIRSPSRVMMEYGEFISQGLGIGISNGEGYVTSAADGLGQSVTDRVRSHFSGILTNARNLTDVFDNIRSSFAGMLSDMSSRLLQSGLSGLFGSIIGAFDPLAGALRGAGLPAIPALAGGGRVVRPGLFQVNEVGGEVRKLSTGDMVFPHDLSKQMAASAGQATGGGASIHINVSGARGNAEIEEMVASGVRQGLQHYDRDILPDSVLRVSGDNNQRYGNT